MLSLDLGPLQLSLLLCHLGCMKWIFNIRLGGAYVMLRWFTPKDPKDAQMSKILKCKWQCYLYLSLFILKRVNIKCYLRIVSWRYFPTYTRGKHFLSMGCISSITESTPHFKYLALQSRNTTCSFTLPIIC